MNATPDPLPAAPWRVRIERGSLHDVTVAAVMGCVSRHPPFLHYAFGLMVNKLTEQLRHGTCVLAISEGRLVAYAGWLRVDETQAARWQRGECDMPRPDWTGGAAIVNVTVTDNPALIRPLLQAVSHVCAGLPVYRMRSFRDGRADMRRLPITGRRHAFK